MFVTLKGTAWKNPNVFELACQDLPVDKCKNKCGAPGLMHYDIGVKIGI